MNRGTAPRGVAPEHPSSCCQAKQGKEAQVAGISSQESPAPSFVFAGEK